MVHHHAETQPHANCWGRADCISDETLVPRCGDQAAGWKLVALVLVAAADCESVALLPIWMLVVAGVGIHIEIY
jgi:hypothetical protein